MKTTTFDATELGLLERDEFTLVMEGMASKVKGDTYFEVQKLSTSKFTLSREQGNTLKESEFITLRSALKNI